MNNAIKKADIIFVGILIIIILISTFPLLLNTSNSADMRVSVIKNGTVLYDIPLNTDSETKIENVGTLVIKKGKAHLEDVCCNDKICSKLGEISQPCQTIICLPNKTVIKINSTGKAELDGISG